VRARSAVQEAEVSLPPTRTRHRREAGRARVSRGERAPSRSAPASGEQAVGSGAEAEAGKTSRTRELPRQGGDDGRLAAQPCRGHPDPDSNPPSGARAGSVTVRRGRRRTFRKRRRPPRTGRSGRCAGRPPGAGRIDVTSPSQPGPAPTEAREDPAASVIRRPVGRCRASSWLARISHQDATAATHLRALTRDPSLRVLDVASATPPHPSVAISCHGTDLRRLATRPGEKCGLI
jgi:hypothetical protein